MIPIAQPLLGTEERDAVLRVIASGQLAQGEHVAAFEQRFAEMCAMCVRRWQYLLGRLHSAWPCDMRWLIPLAEAYDLAIIENAYKAHGD